MIVSVSLQTLDRVVHLKIKLIHYLTEQVVIVGHLLKTRVEAGLSVSWKRHLFEPGVLPDDGNRGPLLRVSIQNLCEHISSLCGDKLGDLIVSTQYFLIELGSFGIFERKVPADHRIEHHPGAPNVSLKPVVSLPGDHLGSCVARGAARRFQGLAPLVHVTQTEIYYF